MFGFFSYIIYGMLLIWLMKFAFKRGADKIAWLTLLCLMILPGVLYFVIPGDWLLAGTAGAAGEVAVAGDPMGYTGRSVLSWAIEIGWLIGFTVLTVLVLRRNRREVSGEDWKPIR